MGVAADPQSQREIEHLASAVRTVLGLGPRDRIDGMALFERLDDLSVTCTGRMVSLAQDVKDLPLGVEAETWYSTKRGRFVISLSESTYHGLEERKPRALFTLGHELGHAVMHAALIYRRTQMHPSELALQRRQSQPSHPVYCDSEWQADTFASCLLVDRALLDALSAGRVLAAGQVAALTGVSLEAAQVRLAKYTRKR